MKTKFSGILTLLLAFTVHFAFAQKTITGTVSDDTGPLPGVSVLIKGTTTGTETDFDGKYVIQANTGDVLQYSYIGLDTSYKTVGASNTIDVVMSGGEVLEEVVVTAQGIKREKKALGYAVTEVKAEAVEQKPEGDISRVLQGKVAGVNIAPTGGMAGSGTSVTIRSKISIEGSNQPLYIVDGVPFNTNTNDDDGQDFTGATGGTGSSRSLDIDPNNIESISVLKGFSATVLYGNEGRNGVILITTKNGKISDANEKFEVTVSQSTAISSISNLPEYQNKYGGGADLNYNNGYVGTWGPEFDPDVMVAHNYNQAHITPFFPEYAGLMVPYMPAVNNVSDFFRTGFITTTSVNAGKSTEKSGYNFNFGRTSEEGYIPENELGRLSFGLGGNAKLSNKFTVNSTFNFVKTNFKAPPIPAGNGANGGSSIFTRLLFMPRNFDLMNLPYQNPIDGSSIYYRTDQDSPRWLLKNAGSTQGVNRFFGKVGITYDLSDHMNLTYRLGMDSYTETRTSFSNKGGTTTGLTDIGYLRQTSGLSNTSDHSLLINGNGFQFTDDIGLTFVMGATARKDAYDLTGSHITGQVVFDFFDNSNFENMGTIQHNSVENTLGVFGQFEFDFYKAFYLTLAARNDWTSTLEPENNSQFYPSVSFSFLPTKFDAIRSDYINFLKLRGGFASSAGFPAPYSTRPLMNVNTTSNGGSIGGVTTQSLDDLLPNPNLKPELHKEYEVGLEGKFIKNRVKLDLSVYRRISTDQILRRSLDEATGYSETFVNVGRIDTDGVELGLNINPVKNDNFNWNIDTNFSAYESIVEELPEGQERIAFAGFSNLGNYAIEGEALGVIVGSYALRDDNGNYLIDFNDGTVIDSDADAGLDDEIIGDPNPDWKASLTNSLSYKGFTLSGQLEYTHGGDIYSLTAARLWRRGVTTANIMDRDGAVVLPGTLADPSTGELVNPDGEPLQEGELPYANHIPITVNSVYFINTMDNSAESVYDGSVIRIREVALSYAFNKDLVSKTPFGSISLTLSGHNVWFDAINFPDAFNFDPEVLGTGVGNGMGFEFQTAPSSKKYALSVKATF